MAREEQIKRREEEEKNKKAYLQADEHIHTQDATAHPSSSILNLPANDSVPMASPGATAAVNIFLLAIHYTPCPSTRPPLQYRLQITWNHTPLPMAYSLTRHPRIIILLLKLASQVHFQL